MLLELFSWAAAECWRLAWLLGRWTTGSHTHTHGNRNTKDAISVNVWLTGLVDSAKGMSGVVFAGLEAVFTEVKVVAVSAFEPGTVYREHLAAIAPEDNTSSYMSIILRCIENWADRNLKHIHTSLQGEHLGPIPFQTTNQSSGTAGGSLRLHLFHWHWKLKQNHLAPLVQSGFR